jgi:hypothetical protein
VAGRARGSEGRENRADALVTGDEGGGSGGHPGAYHGTRHTLSVSISASTSPLLSLSPSFFDHLAIFPAVMVGESAGMGTGMPLAEKRRTNAAEADGRTRARRAAADSILPGFKYGRICVGKRDCRTMGDVETEEAQRLKRICT